MILLLSCLSLALLVGSAPASTAQHAAPPAAPPDVRALAMAELLDALPVVGRERCPNGEIDPAVVEIHRRLRDGPRLTDDQWRAALLRAGAVRVRHSCWIESPFYFVWLHLPEWLPECSITLTPRVEGLLEVAARDETGGSCGLDFGPSARALASWQRYAYELSEGHHLLAFDATIRQRSADDYVRFLGAPRHLERLRALRNDDPIDADVLWSGELNLEVTVTRDLASFLRTDRSAMAAEAVRSCLSVSFSSPSPEQGGGATALVVLDPLDGFRAELEFTDVWAEVEVIRSGVVMQRSSVADGFGARFYPTTCDRDVGARTTGATILNSIPSNLEFDVAARRGWSLRFQGRPLAALMDPWATAWWDGSFTISLDELIAHGETRARRLGR